MRQLRPVDVIVDIDVPQSGFVTDDSMDGPYWTTLGVCSTFFGRRRGWLIEHLSEGHVVLDGEELQVPRRSSTDRRHWRLVDVERLAHALAQNGYLGVDQLVRVIEQVRIVAESWGYIEPRPIPTRVEAFDPEREEVHAVDRQEDVRDDLDKSPGAAARRFSLGDVEYHLDLTDEHWNDLVAAVAPFVRVARRNPGRTDDPKGRADRARIRAWAKQRGLPVGDRGPIPMATMRAYLGRRGRYPEPEGP